jgi:NADPH:quinone reductase-like Zn-dependent oxidoreductase
VKAIVCTKFGSPEGLRLQEVETPTPAEGEVRVKVRAGTVTTGDVTLRILTFPRSLVLLLARTMGLRNLRRRIPGFEFAGDVDSVGAGVTRFRRGDAVFGTTTNLRAGANAEYVCVPEVGVLAPKPETVTFEEAAAVPIGGTTALHFLRKGNVQSGHTVLVYGASGSVGTFGVQLAAALGARVTGVCSTANLELVRTLGAEEVVDYTKTNFADREAHYEVVFDAVGKAAKSDCLRALAPNGTYVTVRKGLAKETTEGLLYLKRLIEAGQVRSVIDRRYPLEQVAEAHRYVEAGHKKGNVILTV